MTEEFPLVTPIPSPPSSEVSDKILAMLKAAANLLPYGGAGVVLFDALFATPLARRQAAWAETVMEELTRLGDTVKGFNIEELSEDEVFLSALVKASRSAIREHQIEKLDALRNGLLNVAIHREPEEDIQSIFLRLIEELSVWHLKLLALIDNPPEFIRKNRKVLSEFRESSDLRHMMFAVFPQLEEQREFLDLIVNDLFTKGLTGVSGIDTMMTPASVLVPRTTKMGRRFVRFVSYPEMDLAGS